MSKTQLKYVFLIIFVIINIFGINKNIPTISLLKFYIFISVFPLLAIYFIKNDIVNLFALWFISALFSDIGMISLPKLPDIFIYRAIWVFAFLLFIFELVQKKRDRILPLTGIEVMMIFFSLLSIVSMIVVASYDTNDEEVRINFFLNPYGMPFSLFFIAKNVVDDEKKINKLFKILSMIGLYLGLTAIFEMAGVSELVFPGSIMDPWKGSGWGRARGPFLNPAVNGTVMGMLIFTVIFAILKEKKKWVKTLFIISLACLIVGLFLTLTRACWLAFIIAILVTSLFLPQIRKYLIAGFLLVITVGYFLFYVKPVEQNINTKLTESQLIVKEATFMERLTQRVGDKKTIEGRVSLYKISLQLFLKNPVFGSGYGAFNRAKEELFSESSDKAWSDTNLGKDKFIKSKATVHDTLVGVLVELGLAGLGMLFLIFYYLIRAARELIANLPQGTLFERDAAVIFVGMLTVFIINIQFIESRLFLYPNSLLFFIAGIIVGLNQRIHRHGQLSSVK